MKSYCVEHMGMTEDVASKRIQAARAAKRFPRIFGLVAKGWLSVSSVVVLAAHLTEVNANDLLDLAAGRTRSEIQFLLETRLRGAALEPNFPLDGAAAAACPEDAPGHPAFAGVSSDSVTSAPSQDAPGHVAPGSARRRGRLAPSAAGACEVRLTLTAEEREVLQQVQALASHTEWGSDPALVYAKAMKLFAEYLLAQKLGKGTGDPATSVGKGRRIPMAIKLAVWKRDGGKCSFVGPDGHRCGETHHVDFDHIVPVAMGGSNKLENVRLLCHAHNQHEAERIMGRDYVLAQRENAKRDRELAKRAREQAKASKLAEKARAAEIAAAKKARMLELVPGLSGVGFSREEIAAAAEHCESIADASVDDRMLLALQFLGLNVGRRESPAPAGAP
ncbi:MAG: HNH endonuclease [Candidatus Eisenbacteria bacterium]|nr:HNH endonuclease [Candidatus Eisenbacteria bacterium]